MAFVQTIARDDSGLAHAGFSQCTDCGRTSPSSAGGFTAAELAKWEKAHLPPGTPVCLDGLILAGMKKKLYPEDEGRDEEDEEAPDLTNLEELEAFITRQIVKNGREHGRELTTGDMEATRTRMAHDFQNKLLDVMRRRSGNKRGSWRSMETKRSRRKLDEAFVAGYTAAYADAIERLFRSQPQ